MKFVQMMFKSATEQAGVKWIELAEAWYEYGVNRLADWFHRRPEAVRRHQ